MKKLSNRQLNILIYLRKSSGGDISILEKHKNRLIRFAKIAKYNLIEPPYEEVVSGAKSIEERVQLNLLLERVALGGVDGILVTDHDRLSRDREHGSRIEKILAKHGCLIITEKDIINPSDPKDKLMSGVRTLFAEHERAVILARTYNTKIEETLQGKAVSGRFPYGYKRNPNTKKLEIVEEEAAVIRKVFQMYLDGHGIRGISDKLTAEGIFFKGKPFSRTTLRRFLECETYIGTISFNEIKTPNAHPPIISSTQFLKVSEKLAFNKVESNEKKRRGSTKTNSIFRNLIYCGMCGAKMYFNYQYNAVRLKNCDDCRKDLKQNKALGNDIIGKFVNSGCPERLLAFKIKDTLNDALMDYIEKTYDFYEKIDEKKLKKELKFLEMDKKEFSEQLERLIDQVAFGVLSQNQINNRINTINENIKKTDLAINSVTERLEEYSAASIMRESMDLQKMAVKLRDTDIMDIIVTGEATPNEKEVINEFNRQLSLIIKKINYIRDKDNFFHFEIELNT